MGNQERSVRRLLGAIGIVICVVASYWPALHAGFVWDDDMYVTENATLRSLDGLRRLWLERGAVPQYYPLTHTTFWLEYHLWGLAPVGYHAVNVLLHAANALLVWRLLDRLRVPGAFLAGAIFAVHPIHVESVAWVTERKNLLSGFFYLLAGGAYLRVMGLEGSGASPRSPLRLEVVAVILFACALLSKSVTVTLPGAIALLILWKRGRIERHELVALGSALVLGLIFSLQTAIIEKVYVGAVGEEWHFSFAERLLIAGRALWFYLGKLAWPTDLLFVYPRWTLDPSQWWQWSFPVAALLVGTLLFACRRVTGDGPIVAALYYAGTLVPALGVFDVYPMRFSFVANHFAYLATIGPIALAASTGARVAARLPRVPREALRAGAVFLILSLAVLSNRESRNYRDLPALWTSTIARNPGCWLCECNLGMYLLDRGQIDASIRHSERALVLKPDYMEAMINLGSGLLFQGRIDEAITRFGTVLARYPDSPEAQAGLGNALVKRGEAREGIAHLEEAVRLAPGSPYARLSLGVALAGQGRTDEAMVQLEQAVSLRPDWMAARKALARARGQAERRSTR
ncbi:MAG TPA: tetratricopeptide repeat protein [Myxococcota bacterium]|nr:tetratricopeptide repeat protein [Myxococcota bacterium]